MASGTENRYINVFIDGKQVGNNIKEIEAAYRKTNNELKKLTVGSAEYNKKLVELKTLKGHIDEHRERVKGVAAAWLDVKSVLLGVVGGNIITSGLQRLVSFFPTMINSAAELSDQLADVQKTTGLTAAEVENLSKAIDNIDTRTSKKDLLDMAVVAGQIGIEGEKNILGFVDSVDKLNVALGDEFTGGAEEVAKEMGTLRNVLTDMKSGDVANDMLRLGNAINELGADGFATGPVVTDFANRIGGLAGPLGWSSGQILGLSATLQELNVNAEVGGTAITKILSKMSTDTASFAEVAGMSIKDFEELLNKDMYGAFVKVMEGSKKMGTSNTALANLLSELELSAAGASQVFAKLGENTDMLKQKVDLATTSLQGNESIMAEFQTKNQTLGAQLEKLKKDIAGVFTGSTAKSIAGAFVGTLVTLFGWIKRNAEMLKMLAKTVITVAVAYGTFKGVGAIISKITEQTNLLNGKMKEAGGAIAFAKNGIEQLARTIMANPIGFFVSAIVAAISAINLFEDATNSAAASQERFNAIISANMEAAKRMKENVQTEIDAIVERYNVEIELARAAGKETDDLEKKKVEAVKARIEKEKQLMAPQVQEAKRQMEEELKKIKMLEDIDRRVQESGRLNITNEEQKLYLAEGDDIKRLKNNYESKRLLIEEYYKGVAELEAEGDKIDSQYTIEKTRRATELSREKKEKAKEHTDYAIEELRRLQKEEDQIFNERFSGSLTDDQKEVIALEQKFQKLIDQANAAIEKLKQMAIAGDANAQASIQLFELERAEIQRRFELDLQHLLEVQAQKTAEAQAKAAKDAEEEVVKANADAQARITDALMDENERRLAEVHAYYQELLAMAEANGLSTYEINKKYMSEIAKTEKEIQEERKKARQGEIDEYVDKFETYYELVSGVVNAFGDLRKAKEDEVLARIQSNYNKERAYLEESLAKKMITQEEFDRFTKALEEKKIAEERKIKEEQFKRERRARFIESLINTAVSVTRVLYNPVLAAATAIAGGLQSALIMAQPVPQFRKGGVVDGPRHEQGGIKLVDSRSGAIRGEMEGGEAYMILSRDTVAKNRGMINALLDASMNRNGSVNMRSLMGSQPRMDFGMAQRNISYRNGGIVPSSNVPVSASGNSGADTGMQEVAKQMAEMKAIMMNWPKKVKAVIQYRELEEYEENINSARDLSSMK